VREAVARARADGMSVAVLYTKMIFPLPHDAMEKFMTKRQAIIVPEMNSSGQFARMIQAEFWREVISVRKFGGVPFATRDIYAEIQKAYANLGKASGKKSISAKRAAPKKKVTTKKRMTRRVRR